MSETTDPTAPDEQRRPQRPPLTFQSLAVHADGEFSGEYGVAPSIDMAVTFSRPGQLAFHENAALPRPMKFYARYGNPTVSRTGALISALHGTESALLTSSGMAAIATTLFTLLSAGDHIVAPRQVYGETQALLEQFARFRIEVTYLETMTPATVEEAIRENTRLVYAETPSNPMMRVTDLAGVAEVARAHDVLSIADNTLSSPVNCRPAEHGIDIVVESATKFMGGHSDVVAGVIAGPTSIVQQMWSSQVILGCTLAPHDAWLLQRGLRTLPLRVTQQNSTALKLARALEQHPRVMRVHYPGLESSPGHEVAARQMDGFGGLLSFELDGGLTAASRFIEGLDLLTYAASLGDVHSLAMHPAAAWIDGSWTPDESTYVPDDLVRISIGIEDAEDVVRDVLSALDAIVDHADGTGAGIPDRASTP